MKALIVFKQRDAKEQKAYLVPENKLRHELDDLKKNGHEICAVFHLSVSIQLRYAEFFNVMEVS